MRSTIIVGLFFVWAVVAAATGVGFFVWAVIAAAAAAAVAAGNVPFGFLDAANVGLVLVSVVVVVVVVRSTTVVVVVVVVVVG